MKISHGVCDFAATQGVGEQTALAKIGGACAAGRHYLLECRSAKHAFTNGTRRGLTIMAWDQIEVEATVADYLHMLLLELSGQTYSKTAHRRGLLAKLDKRTDSAIEFKHQNISAILIDLGYPYITGYKPRGNYQQLLREVVEDRIAQDQLLDNAALAASSAPAVAPLLDDFSKLLVDAPKLARTAREPSQHYRLSAPQKRDYLEREARNTALGFAGEEFILNFEHFRLHNLGHKALADKV